MMALQVEVTIFVFHEVQGSKATGAFILTASHNPGGPHEVSTGIFTFDYYCV